MPLIITILPKSLSFSHCAITSRIVHKRRKNRPRYNVLLRASSPLDGCFTIAVTISFLTQNNDAKTSTEVNASVFKKTTMTTTKTAVATTTEETEERSRTECSYQRHSCFVLLVVAVPYYLYKNATASLVRRYPEHFGTPGQGTEQNACSDYRFPLPILFSVLFFGTMLDLFEQLRLTQYTFQ